MCNLIWKWTLKVTKTNFFLKIGFLFFFRLSNHLNNWNNYFYRLSRIGMCFIIYRLIQAFIRDEKIKNNVQLTASLFFIPRLQSVAFLDLLMNSFFKSLVFIFFVIITAINTTCIIITRKLTFLKLFINLLIRVTHKYW